VATTALTIINRAQRILLESGTGVRWTQTELLDWLNAGQQEIVALRHDAGAKIGTAQLAAGVKQTIPNDGIMLLDVLRNMGTNGTTPGAIVRKVPREALDALVPSWTAMTAVSAIKHYTFNVQTPKVWHCYPPSDGTGYVELLYVAMPLAIAGVNDNITLDDVYANALLDYVLYRAYSKDAETPANAELAVAYRNAFDNGLGLRAGTDAANVTKPEVRG
jgi:hypothetical protein